MVELVKPKIGLSDAGPLPVPETLDLPPGLRIRHLEIFWAVIRTGSQHKAANLLGLSQPAVSQLVRHLEDRLGLELFARTKGRLVPTPEALQIFELVDEIMSRVGTVERFARDLKRGVAGRVMLAMVPGLSTTFIPQQIGDFLARNRDARVAMKVLPTQSVVDRVVSGEADLGFVFGPIDKVAAESVVLGRTEIVCVLARSHRLASRSYLEPADLRGEPIITGSIMPRWGKLVEEAFEAADAQRMVVSECSSPDLAIVMAAQGAGIAVVPRVPVSEASLRDTVTVPFRPTIELPIMAIYSTASPPEMSMLMLLRSLKRTAPKVAGG